MQVIDASYLNSFFSAAQQVCESAMNLHVVPGKARLVQRGERLWKLYPISARITLSDAMVGCVLVSFSERVALSLASALAGEVFSAVNDCCKDALREMANLIVGSAKRDFPNGLVSVSLPRIVETQHVPFPPHWQIIAFSFDASMGRFIVQFAFDPVISRTMAVTANPAATPSTVLDDSPSQNSEQPSAETHQTTSP